MIWITRARPKTDRIACRWLIRRFIDPDAEIRYVPAERVLAEAEASGGRAFDAPGAHFGHRPAADGEGEWKLQAIEARGARACSRPRAD